jgi:hypothetical protein
MMSDAEEELARPVRKRASRSNNDGDGVGARKSRGRPRVNKPELDATAADVSVLVVHLFSTLDLCLKRCGKRW